jgi:hypothetical protein
MPADDDDFGDAELDAWIAEDREADEAVAQLLREALRDARGAPTPAELAPTADRVRDGLSIGAYPFGWVRSAAGWDDALPDEEAELMVVAAAATISPRGETGLDAEEESLLLTLERADWLGALVELVRAGPGAEARPADLVAAIHRCPEVETGPDVDLEDDDLTDAGFAIVTTAWLALGLLDRDDRLTAVGSWVLPRALARAWGSDFDQR